MATRFAYLEEQIRKINDEEVPDRMTVARQTEDDEGNVTREPTPEFNAFRKRVGMRLEALELTDAEVAELHEKSTPFDVLIEWMSPGDLGPTAGDRFMFALGEEVVRSGRIPSRPPTPPSTLIDINKDDALAGIRMIADAMERTGMTFPELVGRYAGWTIEDVRADA